MSRSVLFFSLVMTMLAGATAAVAQGSTGPVSFQPGLNFQKRCLSPSPGPGASNQTKKATIGQGKAMIDTGDPKNSSWTEPADLADAGAATNADMLWDASSKIFYTFARITLQCTHGKSIEGDILIGVYGKKNFLSKVPDSGWWVVDLQQNQCQAPLAGLYGCKFGALGNILACGRAELDPRINDMAIVESTRF